MKNATKTHLLHGIVVVRNGKKRFLLEKARKAAFKDMKEITWSGHTPYMTAMDAFTPTQMRSLTNGHGLSLNLGKTVHSIIESDDNLYSEGWYERCNSLAGEDWIKKNQNGYSHFFMKEKPLKSRIEMMIEERRWKNGEIKLVDPPKPEPEAVREHQIEDFTFQRDTQYPNIKPEPKKEPDAPKPKKEPEQPKQKKGPKKYDFYARVYCEDNTIHVVYSDYTRIFFDLEMEIDSGESLSRTQQFDRLKSDLFKRRSKLFKYRLISKVDIFDKEGRLIEHWNYKEVQMEKQQKEKTEVKNEVTLEGKAVLVDWQVFAKSAKLKQGEVIPIPKIESIQIVQLSKSNGSCYKINYSGLGGSEIILNKDFISDKKKLCLIHSVECIAGKIEVSVIIKQ